MSHKKAPLLFREPGFLHVPLSCFWKEAQNSKCGHQTFESPPWPRCSDCLLCSPRRFIRKVLLSRAHSSLGSSRIPLPKQQELNLLLGDKIGIHSGPSDPQCSHLAEAQYPERHLLDCTSTGQAGSQSAAESTPAPCPVL